MVRHVGRLLDGRSGSSPHELVNDGMLQRRGLDTVRITKVEGHADEGMVLDGRVREQDRLGNNVADEAADFGRKRVGPAVVDAGRNLSGFVVGILLFWICNGSSSPSRGPWLITMG